MKLKHRIHIMIVLCSFIPVCIWLVFSVYDSRQKIENVVTENVIAIGGSQILSIQNFCEGRKESMEMIAAMKLVKNAVLNYKTEGHCKDLDDFLNENESSRTYIASISVVDTDFYVVGSSQEYIEDQKSELQYSRNRYHTGEFIMGNVYDRETDEGVKHILPAYIGIYHEGELIGYLVEEIECEYFNNLRLQTDFLDVGTLYLFDENMQIITAGTATETRENLISTAEERQDYVDAWNAFDHEAHSEGVIYYKYGGQKYVTYFADVPNTDWSIRMTENISAQLKANRSVYLVLIAEGIVLAGMLVYVQMMLTRKLIAPFNRIVSTLKNIKEKHDYSLRTGVQGKDEVSVVAQGIDELIEYIEREELEEKRKHREFEERANANAEAWKHKEFLSAAMLANMPSGYHRCLPDAENGFPFLQLGSHFEEILGWTAEEIQTELGNCYRNLIWPEDLAVVRKYMDMVRVGAGNAYDTSVYRMKHKDGHYRWITDATMFVDMGEESFFQGVIADITHYVEGMEEAKKLAEASSHAKTDFLSQMSHDIRTPMNAIIGFTNLTRKSDDLKMIKEEYLPKIETAGNQLLMIINDVLEMNSIERGKIVFHNTPCDLYRMAQDLMTVMHFQAEGKGVGIASDIQVTDRYVLCDEGRFNRVFMNLMSNAVKFTPSGGKITISMEQKGEKEADGRAPYLFRITDTGIGMSSEFAPLVFEPFERERTSTVSKVEGTGLGMAIVKSIVDAAGGSITVDSTPNVGTTFSILLRLELTDREKYEKIKIPDAQSGAGDMSEEAFKARFQGKRILLVEDNEFNRMIAETVLENAGFVVETAEDGHIAVQMIKTMPSEDYYQAVLMDIQMPIMNGYEATKAIRAIEDERSKVKIIAVTANAFESDKQNAKDVGMDGHIAKPIDVDSLYRMLLEVMDNR